MTHLSIPTFRYCGEITRSSTALGVHPRCMATRNLDDDPRDYFDKLLNPDDEAHRARAIRASLGNGLIIF
jgi:hypothetical protein